MNIVKPNLKSKAQSQKEKLRNKEFVFWFMDFGLLLWTEDDSELPTGPPTITKTLKTFL